MAAQDRTYWHVTGARSWHARKPYRNERMWVGPCGRVYGLDARHPAPDESDRLPPTAHLCGNCSRIIAARTDIESREPFDPTGIPDSDLVWMGDTPIGRVPDRVSDIPEPVASEQDDSGVLI